MTIRFKIYTTKHLRSNYTSFEKKPFLTLHFLYENVCIEIVSFSKTQKLLNIKSIKLIKKLQIIQYNNHLESSI